MVVTIPELMSQLAEKREQILADAKVAMASIPTEIRNRYYHELNSSFSLAMAYWFSDACGQLSQADQDMIDAGTGMSAQEIQENRMLWFNRALDGPLSVSVGKID